MEEVIFDLGGVHFSYLGKFPALCGIDMQVKEGEMIALLGANGSGKSSLLHLLDGLIFPDRGTFRAFGRNITESIFNDEKFSLEFRKKVGFVFQNSDVQLFCPTAEEDILFAPLHLGMKRERIEERFNALVSALGIKSILTRPPHHLSTGEKRKVAIASTLITDPQILLLDEPTAGLDPLTIRHIIDIIIEANEQGKTIITATHDLHIVEELSNKVYILSQEKRIDRYGVAAEVLADRELLKRNNLAHIHRHRHKDKAHIHPHEHLEHHPE